MASKITLEWIILPSHALKVAPNRIVLRFQLYLLCHTAALLPRAQKCTPKNSLPVFDSRGESAEQKTHLTSSTHGAHMLKRGVCIFVEQAGPIYKISTFHWRNDLNHVFLGIQEFKNQCTGYCMYLHVSMYISLLKTMLDNPEILLFHGPNKKTCLFVRGMCY